MKPILDFDYCEYKGKAGIYRLVNIINGKSYIGQSINLGIRIRAHIRYMKRGTENLVLYRAVRKYGIENFYIEILTVLPELGNLKNNLDICEKIYISYYNSYKCGYNSTIGGDGGILGYRMSDEEKFRRSLAQKGKKKDIFQISHRAKTVYMYNITTEMYVVASSTLDAAEMINALGMYVDPKHIQDVSRGILKQTSGFICAYNLEELKKKIETYNESKNKKAVRKCKASSTDKR